MILLLSVLSSEVSRVACDQKWSSYLATVSEEQSDVFWQPVACGWISDIFKKESIIGLVNKICIKTQKKIILQMPVISICLRDWGSAKAISNIWYFRRLSNLEDYQNPFHSSWHEIAVILLWPLIFWEKYEKEKYVYENLPIEERQEQNKCSHVL